MKQSVKGQNKVRATGTAIWGKLSSHPDDIDCATVNIIDILGIGKHCSSHAGRFRHRLRSAASSDYSLPRLRTIFWRARLFSR